MKLKQITFTLENCDCITIDGKYVGDFLVDDIHTNFERTACNSIEKVEVANTFAIEIHKDANKERYEFGQTQNENCRQKTFDRLMINRDITKIEFDLEDTNTEDGQMPCIEHYGYYVDWEEDDDDGSNEAQSTYVSKGGHLYITIAIGKIVEDFFNLDRINNSRSTDFRFLMYGIGDGKELK